MAVHCPVKVLMRKPKEETSLGASFPYKLLRQPEFQLPTCYYTMIPPFPCLAVQFCKPAHAAVMPHNEAIDDQAGYSSALEGETVDSDSDSDDDDPRLMSFEEREELRRRLREVHNDSPNAVGEQDPEEKKRRIKKLLEDYSLVVEEEDPNWPEDEDGWGFNFDQFFNKISIKNVKKDDEDEDCDSDHDIVWQDDDYIRPIKDITRLEWEDTVFKNFNPLVILVHNRYQRPRQNERARELLEKAIQTFWETGWPSPRCVAIDAVVERDLVSALKVSAFPEILFTKAGKILHRDKVVRTADEWSKMMAFFYYKAARPSFIDKHVGQHQEKIPPL